MNRYEIKFDISDYKPEEIIRSYNLFQLHPKRKIKSIYFDTINYDYFIDSEEGQAPRKKVRIRSYDNNKVYSLEFKYTELYHRKKIVINNFVYNYYNFLKKIRENNIKELIHPKLLVVYTRDYYQSAIGRVTIDKNISYQKVNNSFKESSCVINEKKTILEVKIQKDSFDKEKILKFFRFKESRNSKYCNGINLFKSLKRT